MSAPRVTRLERNWQAAIRVDIGTEPLRRGANGKIQKDELRRNLPRDPPGRAA